MRRSRKRDLITPKANKIDAAHSLAKATISAIPVIGGPAAELFALVITPPLERRRIQWMNTVAERFKKLEEEGRFKIQDLRDSELFVTTVMHASAAALRNHQKEKLEALQNAVINSALGCRSG